MKTTLAIFAIYIGSFFLLLYPFMPGRYDTSGIAFSTFIQIYCGVGLITVIPAAFWLCFSLMAKSKDRLNQKLIQNHCNAVKVYFVVTVIALSLSALVIQFISRLVCIILFISIIYFTFHFWRKIANLKQNQVTPAYLPLALILLPVSVLSFQLIISDPLTDWSRIRVIHHSEELIEQIETYKSTYGKYPLTLDAINKDFETGINSIERYRYTYDDTAYNLYFEQTRFFLDNFGTREFVVYNPKDTHLMMSHTVWHMLPDSNPARINQGWYASYETGIKHWKSFLFD